MRGELQFSGLVRVDGTVRGMVSVPADGEGRLHIGTEGAVEGDIRASEVTVEGQVDGSVFATGRVVIGPGGRVAGEVHYGSLEMCPGAEVRGLLAPVRVPACGPMTGPAPAAASEAAPGRSAPASLHSATHRRPTRQP